MKQRRSLFSIAAAMLLMMALSGAVHAHDMSAHGTSDDEITAEVSRLIADVRQTTAHLRNVESIEDAGYGKFLDCFLNRDIGGMGQHFVSGELVGDDILDPMEPEALVFEPNANGDLILVAYEYLVFADVWDPDNTGREAPVLFDREFHLKTNIPGTPPVWTLHIWLWTSNPEGVFADYNPLVFCPDDQPITDMTP